MKKIMFNDKYGLTEAVLYSKKTVFREIIKIPKEIKGLKVGGVYFGCKYEGVEYIPEGSGMDFDCDRFFVLSDENGILIKDSKKYSKYRIREKIAVVENYKQIHSEFDADGCINCPILFDKLSDYGCKNSKGWNNKMFVKADLLPHQIRITNMRVERLQDITDEDCIRSGVIPQFRAQSMRTLFYYGDGEEEFDTPREAYASLIDKINGKGTWDRNPYVFRYEFKLLK